VAAIQGSHEKMVVGVFGCVLCHSVGDGATHVRLPSPIATGKMVHTKNDRIYVGIPHFASKYINDYQYDTEGLEITNPRPNAFHVKQKKSLSMGGGFSGSGYLTAFNASNGATVEFDTDLDLTCIDCLSKIAVRAATDENFDIVATAHPDLKLSGLPTAHLDIHKTMSMDGYNVTGMCSIRLRIMRYSR
jgi:hypothetical protein